MAVINFHHRWVYLMEPHTASRAVGRILCEQLGGSQIAGHHASKEEVIRSCRKAKDFTFVCTVRNPLDLLVTRWKFSPHGKFNDFKDIEDAEERERLLRKQAYLPFLQWVHKNAMLDPFKGMWKDIDIVVYYEDLDESLSRVFNREVKTVHQESHKTSGKNAWFGYWDGLEGQHVYNVFKEFNSEYLDKFGYEYKWHNGFVNEYLDYTKVEKWCKCLPLLAG